MNQSINQSIDQSINQSNNHSTSQFSITFPSVKSAEVIYQSIIVDEELRPERVNRKIIRNENIISASVINQSIDQSIIQSIHQSINQSINPLMSLCSICQSINQSIHLCHF